MAISASGRGSPGTSAAGLGVAVGGGAVAVAVSGVSVGVWVGGTGTGVSVGGTAVGVGMIGAGVGVQPSISSTANSTVNRDRLPIVTPPVG